jgi:hypothetical protein
VRAAAPRHCPTNPRAGRSERQIEPMHTALRKCAATDAIRGDPVIEPCRRHSGIDYAPGDRGDVQPGQFGHRGRVPDQQPRRGAGVGLGVVLTQPAPAAVRSIAAARAASAVSL